MHKCRSRRHHVVQGSAGGSLTPGMHHHHARRRRRCRHHFRNESHIRGLDGARRHSSLAVIIAAQMLHIGEGGCGMRVAVGCAVAGKLRTPCMLAPRCRRRALQHRCRRQRNPAWRRRFCLPHSRTRVPLLGPQQCRHPLAQPVGFEFQRLVLHHGHGRARSVLHPALPLLHHMGQFMAQQLLPNRRLRLILSRGEEDVGTRGEGNGTDTRRLRPDMHTHTGQIGPHQTLQLRAQLRGKWLSRTDHAQYRRVHRNATLPSAWHSSRPLYRTSTADRGQDHG